jgi:hypothetical protein
VPRQPERHLHEVDLAEDDTAGVLDRADDIGVLGRHKTFQGADSERRAKTARRVTVLHPDRDTEERSVRPRRACPVGFFGCGQHSGFVDRDEGMQVRYLVCALQQRGRVGLGRDVAVTYGGGSVGHTQAGQSVALSYRRGAAGRLFFLHVVLLSSSRVT